MFTVCACHVICIFGNIRSNVEIFEIIHEWSKWIRCTILFVSLQIMNTRSIFPVPIWNQCICQFAITNWCFYETILNWYICQFAITNWHFHETILCAPFQQFVCVFIAKIVFHPFFIGRITLITTLFHDIKSFIPNRITGLWVLILPLILWYHNISLVVMYWFNCRNVLLLEILLNPFIIHASPVVL